MWIASLMGLLLGLLLCLGASRFDIREGRIPNALTYPAIAVGLLGWPIVGWVLGGGVLAGELSRAAWGGFLSAAIPYLLLVLTAGLGMGDMKLMAALGALNASWRMVLAVTVYALAVALIMCVWIMIRRGLVRQTLGNLVTAGLQRAAGVERVSASSPDPPGPPGPPDPRAGSSGLDRVDGDPLTPRPGHTPPPATVPRSSGATVPFAVAVTVGLIVAGAEQVLGVPTPWRAYAP